MAAARHLLLIDGMAIVFRGYFAMWDRPRLTTQGLNTSALQVLVNTLYGMLRRFDPSHVVICFDSKPPTFRHKLYADYKSNRGEMPDDLAESLPYVFKLCRAMNIAQLRKRGWEADDIIATVVKRAERYRWRCSMYSPDKDLAQVVSEHTTLYRPGKQGSLDVFDQQRVREQWQITSSMQLVDQQALMGDAVDCIPGVPGIGAKTAMALIKRFGDLESCLAGTAALKGRQREQLETWAAQARLSYQLALMRRDCPVNLRLSDLKKRQWNERSLRRLFRELEFETLERRLLGSA